MPNLILTAHGDGKPQAWREDRWSLLRDGIDRSSHERVDRAVIRVGSCQLQRSGEGFARGNGTRVNAQGVECYGVVRGTSISPGDRNADLFSRCGGLKRKIDDVDRCLWYGKRWPDDKTRSEGDQHCNGVF